VNTHGWVGRLQKQGVKIDVCDTPQEIHPENTGLYYWESDLIELIPDGDLGTLFHELSHWTGHESRLNREWNLYHKPTWIREELIAWKSTNAVASHMGWVPNESCVKTFKSRRNSFIICI